MLESNSRYVVIRYVKIWHLHQWCGNKRHHLSWGRGGTDEKITNEKSLTRKITFHAKFVHMHSRILNHMNVHMHKNEQKKKEENLKETFQEN